MKKNNILKKLVLTTIALLLICNISGLASGINKSVETNIMSLSQQNVVHVNDDYPEENETHFKTIQGGVNHVNTSGVGGTVIVHSGNYTESVLINKAVTIIGMPEDGYGDDPFPPVVSDPSVAFIVIGKNAKGTNICRFIITDCMSVGILVLSSESIKINNTNITSNYKGIHIISSPSCIILHNNIFDNLKEGVLLEDSQDCVIKGNYLVNNNLSGIETRSCSSAEITENHVENNGYYNIWIGECASTNKNTIDRNNIIDREGYSRIKHGRWVGSKNLWTNNYWSDATGLWYFVSGLYVIGYGTKILWFQVDTAAETEPWPYTPNEI
jgi:parallel beta-helix repeat protein